MITVRPAVPADYATVGELTVQAYRADHQLVEDGSYETQLRGLASRVPGNEVLVAVDGDGSVVGSVTYVLPGCDLVVMSGPDEAEFRILAGDPAGQGRGVGEALVRACLDRAAEQGRTAVVLYTRDFAKRAHRLYERLGFVRVPEQDWNPGSGITLLAMRRELRNQV